MTTPKKQPVVACPQCGKDVIWNNDNPYRPFCSERCKLIDLGQWATESYRIPVSGNSADEEPPQHS
ncbi:MAG: DNA gyrase inhibitor YacG [Pseudomonadota bacterium]